MSRYLMILGCGEEELDVDGYFRVEFDTSLSDPEWFGFINTSERAWSVDWIKVLSGDDYETPLWFTELEDVFLEPKQAIELDYGGIKEMLLCQSSK